MPSPAIADPKELVGGSHNFFSEMFLIVESMGGGRVILWPDKVIFIDNSRNVQVFGFEAGSADCPVVGN